VNSGLDFSWLHVSDFHLKDGNRYDSEVVLQALVSSVKRFHGQGRKPDLIFATGDIAHSGKASEYAQATAFFDDLLRAAGLAPQHLFVVPGNHDCDRAAGRFLVRTLARRGRIGIASLDTRQDLHFPEGVAELRMHPLLTAFVREQIPPEPEKTTLAAIRNQQSARFLTLARARAEAPAEAALAATFSSFPMLPDASAQADVTIEPRIGQVVGLASTKPGRFEEARPWFARGGGKSARRTARPCGSGKPGPEPRGVGKSGRRITKPKDGNGDIRKQRHLH